MDHQPLNSSFEKCDYFVNVLAYEWDFNMSNQQTEKNLVLTGALWNHIKKSDLQYLQAQLYNLVYSLSLQSNARFGFTGFCQN